MSDKPLRAVPDWCLHFNGLINDTCHVGVAYADVRKSGVDGKGFIFPCIARDVERGSADNLTCAQRQMPTAEQIRAWDDYCKDSLRRYLEKEKNFICPHCDSEIKVKRQVGRCVYAEPCGHRLYQGRLSGGVRFLNKPVVEVTP